MEEAVDTSELNETGKEPSSFKKILKSFEKQIIGAIVGGAIMIMFSAFTFYYGTKNQLEIHSIDIKENKVGLKSVEEDVSEVKERVVKLEETPERIDNRIDNIEKTMDQLRESQQKQLEQNQKIYEILIQMQREN